MVSDFVGRELERGQLVAVPTSDLHLQLGVVDHIAPSGAVFVATVSYRRIERILVESFAYPANQLVILDPAILNPDVPEQQLVLKTMADYAISQ